MTGLEDRAATEESEIVARLRAGDERAFETLVERHYPTMLAVARHYVSSRAVAEEVVQEAWLGVLNGIDRFEGRSSLRTWILRIVANTAKTRGAREARSVPFTSLAPEREDQTLPADETSLFEQHVNFCDGCDWYLDQMRTTISTVGRITEADVPPETRESLLAAFREWRRS